jgi:hypothetical protein
MRPSRTEFWQRKEDGSEAARFVDATRWLAGLFISPHDPVTWQTFDDKGADPSLAQHFTGDVGQSWQRLRELNHQGAGVFAMVNEGDGRGRATRNVRRVRALFIDVDRAQRPPSAHLRPSMVVASGRGWHLYWCVADCPIDRFKPLQKRLALRYGSDGAVNDLPRVMRVAGFDHCKAAPKRVRVHHLAPWGLQPVDDVAWGLPGLFSPQALRSKQGRKHAMARPEHATDFGTYDILAAFRGHGLDVGRQLRSGAWTVLCPWSGSHTRAADPATASDTVVWPASGQAEGKWPQFHCSHNACTGQGIVDVLREFGELRR